VDSEAVPTLSRIRTGCGYGPAVRRSGEYLASAAATGLMIRVAVGSRSLATESPDPIAPTYQRPGGHDVRGRLARACLKTSTG
jgi:hypothetical protein